MRGRNWQGIPDWLVYAVRWQHATAMQQGQQRAGEDAVELLTGKVLADDPEFTRVIVARYVRTLVRAPKPRKRKKDPRRDALMADCARLDAEGLSQRAIGELKGFSRTKVARLLAEWQTRLPEMPPHIIALSRPGGTDTPEVVPPARDTDPNVIPLRRPA